MAVPFANIDEYIRLFPDDVQIVLERVRQTIRDAVPDAGEAISYQMPAITLDGKSLVYFAAWQRHIGLYPPVSSGDEALERELTPYRGPKGAMRFPFAEPIPYGLIERVVAVLLAQRRDSEQ